MTERSKTEHEARGVALPPMPSFAEFYRAINGGEREPFPWQKRLAEQVATSEQWPAEVGVHTGLGKTSCLDIAVWWLASQADRAPEKRTAPTRIWWVVNRRLLVDSTAEHAEAIETGLSDPDALALDERTTAVLSSISHRLRSLSADPGAAPLEVIRLRGGVASRTPTDPSRPAILLCTVPMYGSRLLFRGYGSTLRAVDAAMAGTDSLVLLDEAHLAPHLRALLSALAECTPGTKTILGEARTRARLVTLTATGEADRRPFGLDAQDEAHPIVRQRLDAAKPLELLLGDGDGARHLAGAAVRLIQTAVSPAACVVFANTPKTARQTLARLRKTLADDAADLLLLTGLTREREAERIRARILDQKHGMAAARDAGLDRQRHLIVVATQTLEVGADIDAEYLVTEACGVRALTQRLGRLNRLGRYAHARAVYVHVPPPKSRRPGGAGSASSDSWPVYGEEPATLLQGLQDALVTEGTYAVDLSPRRVAGVLGPPHDTPGRAPEILPGILWEWTKTTTPPDGEAPVEPYFSGITGPQYSVSLIWRVHVPKAGNRLWPRVSDREAVDVPIVDARDVLGDEDLRRLASDRTTLEPVAAADLRPGDQIVLPVDRGLLDEFGWNPEASDSVVDVSLVGRGLPLDAVALERLCGVSLGARIDTALGTTAEDEDVDRAERDEAVSEIMTAVKAAPVPYGWEQDEWTGFVDTLVPQVVEARKEVPRLPVKRPTFEPPSYEYDETSLAAAVELERHGEAVAARARMIARRIGLSSDLTNVVERAGLLHDIGKADGRFQRWLDPEGQRDVLVAKSDAPRHCWEAMRASAGWPRGGRHEALSARLASAWLQQNTTWGVPVQRELLLHLVISHHGKGRPLVPPVPDGTAAVVSAPVAGARVQTPADLALVDWCQPTRFRQLSDTFGPWALALLEAILIRSDHAVSAGADVELESVR